MSVLDVVRGRWRLEWEDIGEGMDGDYDPNDPADIPLLRTYLYRLDEEFEYHEILSYCTLAPVDTPICELTRMSKLLLDSIHDIQVYRVRTPYEKWTWLTRYGRTVDVRT